MIEHRLACRDRRRILDEICQRAGNFRYAIMEPPHVARLRDEKAAFPEAANKRVKALRQLFAWACLPEYGYATKNPARDVTRLRSTNPDGIRAWTEPDAVRYKARHPIGTKARLAFDLLLYTGVRRSDVVRLGTQMERSFTEKLADGNMRPVSGFSKAKARLTTTCWGCSALSSSKPAQIQRRPRSRAEFFTISGAPPATGMAKINIAPHVIDRILNHVSGKIRGVAAVYNGHAYLEERKDGARVMGALH